jgi:hypothetical protein
MKKNIPHFSEKSLNLEDRIALVNSVYRKLGFVNRKSLMQAYDLSQIEAGSLMRDFIHAHAKNLEWDLQKGHYKIKDQYSI